jgi:hypothetical protein
LPHLCTLDVWTDKNWPASCAAGFSARSRRDRNLARWVFLRPQPQGSRLLGQSDAEAFARSTARRLRAAAARYPGDPEVTELISELLAGSKEFTRLWASHDVSAEHTLCKTLQHPLVGPVTVNCDVLDITDRDQQVVIYTAAPGSPSEEALRLLSVVGTQRMDATL